MREIYDLYISDFINEKIKQWSFAYPSLKSQEENIFTFEYYIVDPLDSLPIMVITIFYISNLYKHIVPLSEFYHFIENERDRKINGILE